MAHNIFRLSRYEEEVKEGGDSKLLNIRIEIQAASCILRSIISAHARTQVGETMQLYCQSLIRHIALVESCVENDDLDTTVNACTILTFSSLDDVGMTQKQLMRSKKLLGRILGRVLDWLFHAERSNGYVRTKDRMDT